jgi:phenylacetate-CoA ligase
MNKNIGKVRPIQRAQRSKKNVLFFSSKLLGLPEKVLKDLRTKKSSYWVRVEKEIAVSLFKRAAQNIPAYQDFLKKHKFDWTKVKTYEDFKKAPHIDKQTYLKTYSFSDVLWDPKLSGPMTIHSTSGSTGEATYFQRTFEHDLRREMIVENFVKMNKVSVSEPTLFIVTFGMGVWSAGMGMFSGAYLGANFNNFPISIVTPGINKFEILKILKNLAPNYKQVIIAAYPPFLKDVLDEATSEGIDLKSMNLRFIFTGESFSEELRDFFTKKAHVRNPFIDTMNTYGTAELGPTAIETPLTILVRRLAYSNKKIFASLFGDLSKTPTLTQYIPYFVNFMSLDGELFVTGDTPAPLVKYSLGDNGGVIAYDHVVKVLKENGVDLHEEAKKYGIEDFLYQLPMVYVYERKNLTTNLYGVLIYPEYIKVPLLNTKLEKIFTGKFVMSTTYSRLHNQRLEIILELKKGVKCKKSYEKLAQSEIIEYLKERSSEYRELVKGVSKRAYPKIILSTYENPKYFSVAAKHKWIKN